jgi:alpha-beta hydrolase superfamily lysophospholipase
MIPLKCIARNWRKASASFLKKRSKKLLLNGSQAVSRPRSQGQSFFCFFFVHKKEVLTCLLLTACAPIPYGHPQSEPGFPIVTSGYFHVSDGAALPYRLYAPAGPPKAVVLALHGYTDSRDGWLILSKILNAGGIAVYAPDQSSFGATANRGLWPGTGTLVAEARDMAVQLRGQYPHTKLVVMGESMGGAIALLLGASSDPPPVDGYVISAPAVWGGKALSPIYRATAKIAAALVPAKRLTGQSVHVQASDNIAALIAFGEDPLTIHEPRVDDVAGLVTLMGEAQAACAHFDQPALILYGGHDQLIPPEAIKSCWNAIARSAPVTLAFYPPDYHLLERDLERATPDADIVSYILGEGVLSDAPSQATVFLAD